LQERGSGGDRRGRIRQAFALLIRLRAGRPRPFPAMARAGMQRAGQSMNAWKYLSGRPEISVVIGALLLVAFFAIGTDGAWLGSIPSVLRITAQVGIIAIGQALLMTSGEVDLSVGSIFAISGVVFLTLLGAGGLSVLPAMVATMVVAA